MDDKEASPASTWNSDSARKWLARIDGLERSGAPIRDLLLERAALQPGERVLDVGCGAGPSAAAAARAVRPGGTVTGIDIVEPMVGAARQRVREDNVEWIVGDAGSYPLPEAHFDVVMSQMGVMFFADPVQAFANLARACRAGGRLIVVVWPTREKVSMTTSMFDSVRATLDRLGLAYREPPLDFGPYSLGDPRRAEAVVSGGGWTDVQVEPVTRMIPPPMSADSETPQSAAEWLRFGPANTLLEGHPDKVYAAAGADWIQAVQRRAAAVGSDFDVMFQVITARR